MSSWAERMQQRAANLGTVVSSCTHSANIPTFRRIEKVKFGVPIGEVCKNDIPGPLLVLILKLNKEGPYKKDVFRAPGHQANMKKLIHFLQTGRLVNIDNFSVYTIASVLKKFFRKLPSGIFGVEGEAQLFQIIELDSIEEQRDQVSWLISSLPVCTQRLIVLLFGTFRVIAQNSEHSQTGMTSEALGVSVAPSFFQSCVSDGKQAKMEDVLKFKVATKIMKFLIDNFGVSNLFGRENYEYYARITGRILKVEEDWIFSFRFPIQISNTTPQDQQQQQQQHILSSEEELDEERRGVDFQKEKKVTVFEEPLLCHAGNPLLDSYTRLSISLEDNPIFKESLELSASSTFSLNQLQSPHTSSNSRQTNSNTRSLLIPQVQERQAARMKTRSEWFLSQQPEGTTTPTPTTTTTSSNRRSTNQPTPTTTPTTTTAALPLRDGSFKKKNTNNNNNNNNGVGCSTTTTTSSSTKETRRSQQQLIRRTSSKKKKDKENGQQNTPGQNIANPLPQPTPNLTSTTNTTTTTTTTTMQADTEDVVVVAPQEVEVEELQPPPSSGGGSYKPRI